jgi:hypothetical protein
MRGSVPQLRNSSVPREIQKRCQMSQVAPAAVARLDTTPASTTLPIRRMSELSLWWHSGDTCAKSVAAGSGDWNEQAIVSHSDSTNEQSSAIWFTTPGMCEISEWYR